MLAYAHLNDFELKFSTLHTASQSVDHRAPKKSSVGQYQLDTRLALLIWFCKEKGILIELLCRFDIGFWLFDRSGSTYRKFNNSLRLSSCVLQSFWVPLRNQLESFKLNDFDRIQTFPSTGRRLASSQKFLLFSLKNVSGLRCKLYIFRSYHCEVIGSIALIWMPFKCTNARAFFERSAFGYK